MKSRMKLSTVLVLIAVLAITVDGKECGTNEVNSIPNTRIVGGKEALKGYWPWQISLHESYPNENFQHVCGGSIINKQWIVTAAHCVEEYPDPKFYRVWVGEHNLELDEGTEFFVEVEKIKVHRKTIDEPNDIALLKLKHPLPIETNDYVNEVCLPENIDTNFDGQMCITTGWGALGLIEDISDTLQEVALPILNQKTCKTLNDKYATVTDAMICAGYVGTKKGGCYGDSGGPLVCKINNKWHLVGITSWGPYCASGGHPTVFVRVSHYMNWIKDIVANN